MMALERSSVMQDIAIAIGERIHELIILEIRHFCREVVEQQDQIKRRLTVLENSFPVRKEIPVNFNQSHQARMKGANSHPQTPAVVSGCFCSTAQRRQGESLQMGTRQSCSFPCDGCKNRSLPQYG